MDSTSVRAITEAMSRSLPSDQAAAANAVIENAVRPTVKVPDPPPAPPRPVQHAPLNARGEGD
jgi:hypothetical protein